MSEFFSVVVDSSKTRLLSVEELRLKYSVSILVADVMCQVSRDGTKNEDTKLFTNKLQRAEEEEERL